MDSISDPGGRRVNRRTVLAGLATGGTIATSGCVRRVRSIVNRDDVDQLSLTITTVPADVDREAIRIARILRDNLEAVGIDVTIEMRAVEEFLRATLINHSYDLSVGRHPGYADPDALYEALHSVFAEESGWQNPYGFTNMTFDELLEDQRERDGDGEDRRDAVDAVLTALAAEQPFVPLCVPEENRLVRTDRFDGWDDHHLATRLGYLGLEPLERADENPADELRAIITDPRATENLNPLSAEYRNRGLFMDLLYDSLATVDDGDLRPWLAESWEWDGNEATVTLRSDLEFHDGESLTAEDVAFTYRLLADTSLGLGSVRSPAPRYRWQSSLVDSVDVDEDDERTLTITVNSGENVGEWAFTVPILPEHIWADRAGEPDLLGVSVAQGTTEAIVTDNIPAIGSGPFQFDSLTGRETLDLERFDEHFSIGDPDLPEPTVSELTTHVEPRSTAAIESIEEDDADVTMTTLESYTIETVTESDDIRRHTSPSQTVYQLGFNTRGAPFSNPYFRRTIARVIDKEWLVEEVFKGHADPVATPVDDEWVPEALEWDANGDGDPVVPFLGSENDLDVDAARHEFEEIGYRHDGDGALLARR